jgi:hypothetical protein
MLIRKSVLMKSIFGELRIILKPLVILFLTIIVLVNLHLLLFLTIIFLIYLHLFLFLAISILAYLHPFIMDMDPMLEDLKLSWRSSL